jgi:hypothetical protein
MAGGLALCPSLAVRLRRRTDSIPPGGSLVPGESGGTGTLPRRWRHPVRWYIDRLVNKERSRRDLVTVYAFTFTQSVPDNALKSGLGTLVPFPFAEPRGAPILDLHPPTHDHNWRVESLP